MSTRMSPKGRYLGGNTRHNHESEGELIQQCLYFRPEPQGQGSFLPTFFEDLLVIAAYCFPSTDSLNNW